MATQKLQVVPTIKEGIIYGLKNIPSLVGLVILYVLTLWIPYLNVGTTVGMYKAVIKIGRGEVINPVDIFSSEHRRNMGDFFLLTGFITLGIVSALAFTFFPALVVSIGWGFAYYFFIDKGLSPVKALKVSWKVTDGEKWRILGIMVLACLAFILVMGILISFVDLKYIGWFFAVLAIAVFLLMLAAIVAIEGVMYRHFAEKADVLFADRIAACACKAPAEPAAPADPLAPAPEVSVTGDPAE